VNKSVNIEVYKIVGETTNVPFRKTEEGYKYNATTMASYRNKNWCLYRKRFNHQQEECRTRIQDNKPCTDNKGRKYWPKQYIDEEMAKRYINGPKAQGPISPISALQNYVTPLKGSQSVVTQIILNLCLAPLTTCNRIYEIFAPGEKNQTQSQRTNRNTNHIMVFRHRSCHHLHEQQII
jgi:hypothetical protein